MPLNVYLLAHVIGLSLLFMALGGAAVHALNNGSKESNNARARTTIFHGLGLLVVLVSGFGMLARLDLEFSGWVAAKLVIWLVLGAFLSVLVRRPGSARWIWWAVPVLVGVAAWLAVTKPF